LPDIYILVKPDKGHLDLYPPLVLCWRRHGRVGRCQIY
jgi:hypothetical protein